MRDEPMADAAQERLLDAGLAQVFGTGGSDAPSTRSSRLPDDARRRTWLAAAAVVLGLTAVVGSWWAAQHPAQLAQNPAPAPLPRAVVVSNVGDLTSLPPTTENLVVLTADTRGLEHLDRFPKLRGLTLIGRRVEKVVRVRAGPLFHTLSQLRLLEELRIPEYLVLQPEDFRQLAELPRLRALTASDNVDNAELAAAIATLPHLRELNLAHTLVDAAFLDALHPARLDRLALDACPVTDESAWDALAKLQTLRTLRLAFRKDTTVDVKGQRYKIPQLDEAAFDAVNALPNLIELDLEETGFADDLIPRLPARLSKLNLGSRLMSDASIDGLRRLGRLRSLMFHHNTRYEACAALLSMLPLEEVTLRGWPNELLLTTIARHPSLARVELKLRKRINLDPLLTAPRLRQLRLRYANFMPPSEDLEDKDLQKLRERGIEVEVLDYRDR